MTAGSQGLRQRDITGVIDAILDPDERLHLQVAGGGAALSWSAGTLTLSRAEGLPTQEVNPMTAQSGNQPSFTHSPLQTQRTRTKPNT